MMLAANHWVIVPLLLPLLAGIVLLMFRERSVGIQRALGLLATVGLLAPVTVLIQAVGGGEILTYALGNWPMPYGIVLVADRLSVTMLTITALLAILTLLYAMRGTDTRGHHFHVLFQLQLFGLNGAFLTGDLFNLFVFFEVLLLASYGLLLHGGDRSVTRAGLHFVVINLAGSALFLVAVGMLYGVFGTLNMADLAVRVSEATPADRGLVQAAGLLLFAVFALKAALLPLHLWLPGAYSRTTAPVAALFAIMTKVGAYAILRVGTLIFGAQAGLLANLYDPWLLPLALVTLAVAALGTLASRCLRRQVAYLILVSVGTLLTAFGIGNQAAIAAGLYYLAHSVFAGAALFLLADAISARRGQAGSMLEAGPTMPNHVLLGSAFFFGAILVAGLPPLSGFLGKFMAMRAALEHEWMAAVLAVMLGGSLVVIVALARAGVVLFFASREGKDSQRSMALGSEMAPVMGLFGLGIVLTVGAGQIMEFTQATAGQILEPGRYIGAVLGQGGGH